MIAQGERLLQLSRVDLSVVGIPDSDWQRTAHDDIPVSTQQYYRVSAQECSDGLASRRCADQQVGIGSKLIANFEYRHLLSKERRVEVDRAERDTTHPESDD